MALIKCPECGKEISDKANICIHCGYPLETVSQSESIDLATLVKKAEALRLTRQYSEALVLYEKAAEHGDVTSQLWAGNFYQRGLGVDIDYDKARYWFEKAAELNCAAAISNLGQLYENANGVPKDLTKAIELYKRASELGNSTASGNLGSVYFFKGDYDLAVHYYTIALNQGSNEGAFLNNLAVCYMDGKGTTKNYEKAKELLIRAKATGNQKAITNLVALNKRLDNMSQHTSTKNASQSNQQIKNNSGCLIFFVIIAILAMLLIGSSGSSKSGSRTCAWCNGTGYSGNGATNAVEYVMKKTPCKHCGGSGKY